MRYSLITTVWLRHRVRKWVTAARMRCMLMIREIDPVAASVP